MAWPMLLAGIGWGGGSSRKLGEKQRHEIAESVISGRKSGAEMARLYGVSEPSVSRIIVAYRQGTTPA
jgi:hypothetical protein